jgi:pimeloyl-ACP methyl ester carboxylesterase
MTMPDRFSRLAAQVHSLRRYVPAGVGGTTQPLVVLLHGLGGDRDDWLNPFQDRNWPFDSRHNPPARPLGAHASLPTAALLGLSPADFISPRLTANSSGVDGSDDRGWWHALAQAEFPVLTYSQVSGVLLPFGQGPVAEFRAFMETLQLDMRDDAAFATRPVVIVGHSRGGLIGRAYLGDPEVKANAAVRFPHVTGLITLSSPHAGSQMALLDDRIIGHIETVQHVLPALPHDIGDHILNSLKAKVASYGSPEVDEIRPGSDLYSALATQEPIQPGIRCISVGGTSPRFLRVYRWMVDLDRLLRVSKTGKIEFHWQAKAVEAKIVSPILDGKWLKAVGVKLDEMTRGRGDGLTADASCRFPASFHEEEHLSFPMNHGEELWAAELQQAIIQRLGTFQLP